MGTIQPGALHRAERACWEMHNNPDANILETAKKFKVNKNIIYIMRKMSNNFAIRPTEDMVRKACEQRFEYNVANRKKRELERAASGQTLFPAVEDAVNVEPLADESLAETCNRFGLLLDNLIQQYNVLKSKIQ